MTDIQPAWWMVSVAFLLGVVVGGYAISRLVGEVVGEFLVRFRRGELTKPEGSVIPPQGGSGTAPIRFPVGWSSNFPPPRNTGAP